MVVTAARGDVPPAFYKYLKDKVDRLEHELNDVQAEIRKRTETGSNGAEFDARPDLETEALLQNLLRKAKLLYRSSIQVPAPKDNFSVQIGSRVEFQYKNAKHVRYLEGLSGRTDVCSLATELGELLCGSKVGDEFDFMGSKVKILNISL